MHGSVRVVSHDHMTVVAITGELDVLAADSLRHRLTALIRSGHRHLVVDLTGVDVIDSTGLEVLVGALKRVTDEDGWMQLVVDSERLLKVLRVSALTQLFPIHRTLPGALAAG